MADYPAIRDSKRCPAHPGELLREDVIPATKKSKAEIARLLGISRQHLYDVLDEKKPVSPSVAVRLASSSGTGPARGSGCRRPMISGKPSRRST
jgi:antitoxin HigA-1